MNRRTTRGATLAAASLLAAGLAVPLTASPADAVAASGERLFYTADTNHDGSYGLYSRAPGSATPTAVVAEDAAGQVDVYDLSTSQQGSRVAFVQDVYSSDFQSGHERVGVADVTGAVRYVDDVAFTGTSNVFDYTPALSPDGNTVVWTEVSDQGIRLRKAPATGGAASDIASGLHDAVFASNTVLLAQDNSDATRSINLDGSGQAAATGFPSGLIDLTVSPNGSKVAWTERSTASAATVKVADLSGTTASNATPVYATGNNYAPTFSQDSATVYFVHHNGTSGDLWSRPADASAPAATTGATSADEDDVADTAPQSTPTPPAVNATPTTFTPAGTTATVRAAVPGDLNLSGVMVQRYVGAGTSGAPTTAGYASAPPAGGTATFVDTGLTPNQTYTYAFTAVDRSGNPGPTPVATKTLVAVKAAPAFADPTSANTVRAPFPVTFATGAPAGTLFSAKYRSNGGSGWTSFTPWVTSATGAKRTFGVSGSGPVASTTATPGRSYQFLVQAQDTYGNQTAWVASGRATVPYDQTAAYISGSTLVSSSLAWYGSYRVIRTTASYATIKVVGDRFQLVGFKCSSCGVFDVYDNGVRLIGIDTYRSSTLARTVLYTKTWSGVGTHTITIKPRATSGRPNVIVDGFAVRH